MRSSCSPSAQKPHSARCITSAPDSVSCTWTTSISLRADAGHLERASGRGDGWGVAATAPSAGLNTSNEPNARERNTAERRNTGLFGNSRGTLGRGVEQGRRHPRQASRTCTASTGRRSSSHRGCRPRTAGCAAMRSDSAIRCGTPWQPPWRARPWRSRARACSAGSSCRRTGWSASSRSRRTSRRCRSRPAAGRTRRAGACRIRRRSPSSAAPERSVLYALISALPPVAHPLATLMNGTPVRPRSRPACRRRRRPTSRRTRTRRRTSRCRRPPAPGGRRSRPARAR